MPRLTMQAPHALGREEALRRMKEKFDALRDAHGSEVSELREQWNENTFRFGFRTFGMEVTGTVAVEDAAVEVAADLPLAAMLFKGRIEDQIRAELDQLLA